MFGLQKFWARRWLVRVALGAALGAPGVVQASVQDPAKFTTGSYDLSTATGTVSYAHNLGQTPKAMILWSGWAGSNANVPNASARTMDEVAFSIGFTDGTTTLSTAYAASDYSGASNDTAGGMTRMSTSGLIQIHQSDQATITQGNFSSWDATNINLNWISAAGVGTGKKWHYLAIGGGKVKAKALSWTLSAHATSTSLTQNVTGFTFDPNTCIHLSSQSEYDSGIGTGTKRDDAVINLGVADWFNQQWGVMNYAEQRSGADTTTDVYHMYNTSNILLYRADGGGTTLHKRVSHTDMITDGFSVAIETATSGNLSDDTRVFTLCLQGVNSFAGTYVKTTSTTTGTHAHSMTSNTDRRFTPGVVIFSSDESTNASQTAPSSKANFHFGAAASTTTEQSTNISVEDGGHEHETYDSNENLVLIKENSYAAPDTEDQTEAEAAMSSFNSDGFTVNWTKADNQATLFPYLALGTPYGTDVKLETFEVASSEQGRSFYWRTGFESGSLGFNIYDQHQGRQRLLTPQVIAGSALLVGVGQPLASGRSYHWQTGPDLNSTQYWLEEISVDGKKTMYGPFTSRRRSSTGVNAITSPLLSDLGRVDRLGAGLPGSPEGLSARDEGGAGPGRIKQPDDLASLPGVQLRVRADGFFRVTGQQLMAAGLDPAVDPRRLQLFAGGYQVRLRVIGEDDGRLDPGDAIEFYGIGNDTLHTDARVYWLAAVGSTGPRLVTEIASPQRALRVGSFPYVVEDRPRSIYFSALLNGEDNNFFGPVISDKALDRQVTVHHLARGAGEPARLRVRLQGASETTHRVVVKVNGQVVGELPFEGRIRQEALFEVPVQALADGENVITLTSGAVEDVVLLDSLRLTYPHGLTADQDAQRVTLPPRRGIKLGGFTSQHVRAFDVSRPDAVVELPLTISWDGETAAATISSLRHGGTVLFVGDKRVAGDLALVKNHPSQLGQAQAGADLLMITHASLAPALEPLRLLRQEQGLKVQVIDVQDVYDEFSFGEKDPGAIRAFLQSAGRTWQRRPRFVLLFGDASFDSRDYLGLGDHDLVPTKLVDTWPLETASDDWFGDFTDEGLSTLAIGRIPARTLEVARAIVDKLVRHDSLSLGNPGSALLIGDQNTIGDDFETMARQAALALPGNMPVSLRFRGQPLGPTDPPTVLEALNGGPSLIQYFGHGSVDLWNGVLSADAAAGLTNRDRLSLVVSMTCLNGFFQDARMTTMAEALLGAPNGGAYAVWASSGYTRSKDQERMGEAFVRAVLQEGLTLGEAARRAKASVADLDVRHTWVLFGDPSQAVGATMKLQSEAPGEPMGCHLSQRTASPVGLVIFAAAALVLRRRRR